VPVFLRLYRPARKLTSTQFIRHLNVPYCPLYDQGYTSLGGTTDTHRNPALRRQSFTASGKPEFTFRPAYELVEDLEERLGREMRASQQPSKQVSHEKFRDPPGPPASASTSNENLIEDDNDDTASM
jgi:3'-phosphoadenosine 5'-phosphosulfate sulfotransferase (PAPS reductase)/FAD synthetase